ncbi:MAG: CHAT domain-containing protein [Candidatus Cloacimonetes bacterium]|nr:CHAT domain-containing protein [Candidatus Cloacimonadota bacterium]
MKRHNNQWLVLLGFLAVSLCQPPLQAQISSEELRAQQLEKLVLEPQAPLSGRLVEEDPALSPDGVWLAYTSEDQGNRDIWIRTVDPGVLGDLPVRVTSHPAPDCKPAWSEDGRWLLFVSNRDDALGDIWRVRVRNRFGSLKLGKAEVVVRRAGPQDNPAQARNGTLYWDEADPSGQRIMSLPKVALFGPTELFKPARRLRVLGDTLTFIAPRSDGQAGLFRRVNGRIEELWSPPGGVLDHETGPEGVIWLCGLRDPRLPRSDGDDAGDRHRGQGTRRALESRTGAGLWLLDRDGLPHELVPASTDPRQLSVRPLDGPVESARLITTEGRERPGLWLLNGWGRLGPAPSAEDLEFLFNRHRGDEMGDLVLSRLRQDFPGSPAAERAILEELRRLLADSLNTPALFQQDALRRLAELQTPDALLRGRSLAQLGLFTDPLPPARADSVARVQETLADSLARAGHTGPAAEALLALARRQRAIDWPDACLLSVLRLEELAPGEPERADALLLKVWAHEQLGQEDAAFGSLEELGNDFPERADLLIQWFRADRVRLDLLPRNTALRDLQHRLARLGRVREFRQAWLVELARREAGGVGKEAAPLVALEDLELVLAQERADCGPLGIWVMTEARIQKALMLKQIGQLDQALDLLAQEPPWRDLAGQAQLANLRVALRLERGQQTLRSGHPVLAEADFRQVLAEQPEDVEALRGWLESAARAGHIEDLIPDLRLAAESDSARAIDFHALGLALSWQSSSNPAMLPESDWWLQRALSASPRTVRPWQTLAWNLAEERRLQIERPEGLASLFSQVGNSRELFNRWRWDSRDRDPEELLDRAVFLLQRAIDLSRLEGRPGLEAELQWNLGNLYFARGEFGAAQSLAAFEQASELGLQFHDNRQRLAWQEKLGITRQWNGHYEGAVQALDSAQQLAARLGESAQQRMLLGRLAQLHSSQGRWNPAIASWDRALALEGVTGQQALILRNRAACLIELGDLEAARQDLAQSAALLDEAEWPLNESGNWLRLKFLGITFPVWNFKDLYTGSGRLHWREQDESLLRQALLARIEGLEGRPDRLLASMNLRRKLLRRQGDSEGMVRMDLAIAAFLARSGRPSQAAARFKEARRLAGNNELGLGLEAQAFCGELQCRLLAGEEDLAQKGLPALEQMLTRVTAGESLPRRLRLELACYQAELLLQSEQPSKDLPGVVDLNALMLRAQALDALDAVDAAAQPALPDRFQLYLARARVHLLLAEPRKARGQLDLAGELLGDDAPAAWTMALLELRNSVDRQAPALGKDEPSPVADLDLRARLESELLLDTQDPVRLARWRRQLEDGRTRMLEAGDSLGAQEQELWLRWWTSRLPFARKGLRFPEESQSNLWNNWIADRQDLDAAQLGLRQEALRLETVLASGQAVDSSAWQDLLSRGQRLQGWLEEDRSNLAADPLLDLLASATALPLDSLEQWPAAGLRLMTSAGPAEGGGRHCADPRLLERMAAAASPGGDYISWSGPRDAWPIGDSLRTSPGDSLLAEDSKREGRVLALDGVLRMDPGMPLGAWFDLGGQRVELRRLLERTWPTESLVLRSVILSPGGAEALEGWLCLERVLAIAGIRRLVCPLPGGELSHARLLEVARHELNDPQANEADANLVVLGAAAMEPAERRLRAEQSLEQLARLGARHLKDDNGERAWHLFRQALGLSQRLELTERSQALLELAARAADTGASAPRLAGPALDVLLKRARTVEQTQESEARLLARLVLLADLAGRERQADSLWAAASDLLGAKARASFPDRRIKHLADQREAVAAASLAARQQSLPTDLDGRRALFLAKVYLDGERTSEALRCFEWPGLELQRLDSLAWLDWLELEALARMRNGELERAQVLLDSSLSQQGRLEVPTARTALTHLRRADLAWEQGLNSQAFLELNQARPLLDDEDDARLLLWENSSGLVRHSVGELPEAIGHFERALEHATALGDHRELSAVNNNLARSLTRMGRPELALEKLLEAGRQDSLAGARLNHVATLRNRAEALLATGLEGNTSDSALEAAQASLSLARELQARIEEGRCLDVLARVRLSRREGRKLGDVAQRMQDLALSRGIEPLVWKAQLRMGQASELDGKLDQADEHFTAAFRELQNLRMRQSGVRFRSGVDSEQEELVAARLRVLVAGRKLERALLVADRSHGRGFEDLLTLRERSLPVDSLLAARRDSLMNQLTTSQNLLSREENPERLRTLQSQYEEQRSSLDRLLLTLEAEGSGLAPGDDLARPPLLRETDQLRTLQAALAPGDLVLFYQLGPKLGQVFGMSRDSLTVRSLDWSTAELEERAEEHRSRILGLLSAGGSGQELYTQLMQPELASRPTTKRLFVVSHGALHRLPFASLEDSTATPIIGRMALIQVPSLALLDWCRQLSPVDGPGLVLAEPVDSGLEFAALEAQAMRASWPSMLVKQGPLAEEALIEEDSQPRRFRHFSCHGVMDPLSPAASGLLLTPGRGADGRLSATEISTLDLPTGLVMLSACDTGLGRSQGGDEVAGLPRAFIVAGAREVVSSLWKVDDLSTAVLVKHFYRNLAAGKDSAEALRLSMMEVRRVLNPHPAYWAAFTLCGWPGSAARVTASR